MQNDLSAPVTPERDARNRLVIYLLLSSTFVVILNETIIGVALPRLMQDLNVAASGVQWLTTAFLLTMAVVIPVTGFLLQRLNTRPVFILAMALFSLGTLICAVSPGLPLLIVGRIVQASGTAIMLPLLMTTIMHLVPPESRGKTMGNISIVISVAPAIGPTISGLVLSVLDWRWMFLLVLPISLASLALGARLIENVTTPRALPIDVLSVVMSAFGFGTLVYGLSLLGEPGAHLGPFPAWALTLFGALITLGFIGRQLLLQRADRALLDFRTFRSPVFAISVVIMAISMMAMFGSFILLPIYMQNVLKLDTLQTGLLLLPGGLVMGLCAPLVGRLYDRYGPAFLVLPGSVLVTTCLWLMSIMDQNTGIAHLLTAHVGFSIGLALMFTPLFSASLGSLTPELYSHGSAVLGTIQQVAGAAGTALFVAILSYVAAREGAEGMGSVEATSMGIQTALSGSAALSVLAIVASLFLRKPEGAAGGAHGH